MTRPIRIMVVDDSVVIRRLLTKIIEADPELEVAGTAANGKMAVERIASIDPDVVTLDVEMPEMNGLEALVELKKTHPRVPVIMFSTLTERGASATLDALSNGAADYVTKPSNVGSVAEAIDRVRSELVDKVKSLCPPRTEQSGSGADAAPVRSVPARPSGPVPDQADIIAIGSSTGGPNALAELVPQLPADLAVPVVIVQHMPPVFTKLLAERLHGQCAVDVHEATDGMAVKPGNVYIAPGDFHMRIVGSRISPRVELNQSDPVNHCRPAVDVLFRSVAELYPARTLAAVLTGMGSDGRDGCEVLKGVGARVVVQDRDSSTVWGMPGAVHGAGLADATLPLADIAGYLNEYVPAPFVNPLQMVGSG